MFHARTLLILAACLVLLSDPHTWGQPRAVKTASEPKPGKAVHTDRYGDPLPPDALFRVGTDSLAEDPRATFLAFSSDGKRLVTRSGVGGPGTVHVWEVATGRQLQRFPVDLGPAGSPDVMALAPDGKALAVARHGADTGVELLDLATGKTRRKFQTDLGVLAVAFSPDGSQLATGGQEQAIILWQVATGKEVRRLSGHEGPVFAVTFSPDGKSLASRGEDKTIRLWDTATGQELRRLQVRRQQAAVTFSPDGRVLASPDGRQTIRRWQVATGERLLPLIDSRLLVPSVAFSPDGKLLAASTADQAPLHLWDTGAGKLVRRVGGISSQGAPFAFSPDGKLVAGGAQGIIYLWDPATGKPLRQLVDDRYCVRLATLSTTGRLLATAGSDGIIRLSDTATGREVRQLRGQPDPIQTLAFSPDDKALASGGEYDRTIVLWDVATGREVRRLEGHPGPWHSLAFPPDGKTLVSWDTGGQGLFGARQYLRVWDLATGKERQHFRAPHGGAFDISGDGTLAATADKDRTIRVWDVASGKERRRWKGPAATDLEFAPGEKFLITESAGMPAAVWEVGTGKPGPRLKGPYCLAMSRDGRLVATQDMEQDANPVIRVQDMATGKELCHLGSAGRTWAAFSPDGRTLATSSPENAVILWEVATGQERYRLKGHRAVIQSLAFSADGTLVVSTSLYGSAVAWDWTGRHAADHAPSRDSSARAQEALWADLASADAGRAFRAVRALLATPRQAAALLRAHARPALGLDAKGFARLIGDLDDNRFAVRQRAARELEGLGEAAEAPLRDVLKGKPSPEVRRQVQELLEKLEARSHSSEYLRGLRTVEILEYLATPEAREVLQRLAAGGPRLRLTQEAQASLERLAKRGAATRR